MTDTIERAEAIDRLREIQEEIEELLGEAKRCIRAAGGTKTQTMIRAEAYWIAHIIGALRNDHGYLGGSMATMQDTIEELESDDDCDEDLERPDDNDEEDLA